MKHKYVVEIVVTTDVYWAKKMIREEVQERLRLRTMSSTEFTKVRIRSIDKD